MPLTPSPTCPLMHRPILLSLAAPVLVVSLALAVVDGRAGVDLGVPKLDAACGASAFPVLNRALATRAFRLASTQRGVPATPSIEVAGVRYVDHGKGAYPWIEEAAAGRVESIEAGDYSLSVSSKRASDGSCTRVIIRTDPGQLQVGLRENSLRTSERYLQDSTFQGLTGGSSGAVLAPGVEPGEGRVHVKVYQDGQPVPNHPVYVRADHRGLPPQGARTFGHEHLLSDGGARATLYVQGQPDGAHGYGMELEVRTNNSGEAEFDVRAGYRGGVEAIIARVQLAGTWHSVARAIVIAQPNMVSFPELFGFDTSPEPSEDFPFLLTGWTDRHYFNHWVQGGLMGQYVMGTMYRVWNRDQARTESGETHYIQLNDMSLEYGGLFRLEDGNRCSDRFDGASHKTHDRGLDFDVSPCYSEGPDGKTKVGADACESGGHRKLDERALVAEIIGYAGGAVFLHSPASDGAPYHYHIRYPQR